MEKVRIKGFPDSKIPKELLKSNLPLVINKFIFGQNEITEKTDEMIHGIYSIREMSEFISSRLDSVKKKMDEFIDVILNKVSLKFLRNLFKFNTFVVLKFLKINLIF